MSDHPTPGGQPNDGTSTADSAAPGRPSSGTAPAGTAPTGAAPTGTTAAATPAAPPRRPQGKQLWPELDAYVPSGGGDKPESTLTVLIAFGANLVIAVAKTVAALITGSASLVAEAAHSWADTGNEVFLLVANRTSRRKPDSTHPLGYGRESYVWSLFAALGLFVAGAAVSIWHGITELMHPEPASDFLVGYLVLALSFVFEGISFTQSVRQARREAKNLHRDLIAHVLRTSDPTLRAVFFEDAAALIGIVIAAAALALHQITGSAAPDAIGSILVGLLLAVVAVKLINLNRRFLVGEEADPRVRDAVIRELLSMPEVDKVSYLRLEIVGPRMINVVGDVDLAGDQSEHHVAERLRALEAKLQESPAVVGAVLSLSTPDEPGLTG